MWLVGDVLSGTDVRLTVDIVQVSTGDSSRCKKELYHVIHHFKLFFFRTWCSSHSRAGGAGVIITAAVTLTALHCASD